MSFTVATADADATACGDTTVLWVSAVEPDVSALGVASDDDDARLRGGISCDGCLLRKNYIKSFPIALDGTDSAEVRFPDEVGPGRFLVTVRTQRGTGVGKKFAWGNELDHLVTDSKYVDLDAAARQAMIAHADEKQDAAGNGADDAQKLWDDGELLRELAASHRHFLRYEKTAGGDRLVEVFGELVGARNVAVVVPGLDADARKGHDIGKVCQCVVSEQWVGNAERLWLNSALQSGHDNTATIAYLGYDAPRKTNVVSVNAAMNGAEEMQSDLSMWQIPESKHLTLIGHSYGSTTLGYALGRGETADDIAFVGSPGVGVFDIGSCDWMFETDCCPTSVGVSCFSGVAAHHSWVARFDEDPVPIYGGEGALGRPPDADDFGAIEFHTEPPQCDDYFNGYSIFNVNCHSHYFSWRYAALDNVTRVVAGRYRDVELVGKHPEVPKNLDIPTRRAGWSAHSSPVHTVRSVDWKNRPYDLYCGRDELETQILVDGEAKTESDGEAPHLSSFIGATYGDVTGDGIDEALISINCAYSASYETPNLLTYGVAGSSVVQLGQVLTSFEPKIIDGVLVTVDPEFGPDDPHCCPSNESVTSCQLKGGAWEVIETEVIPTQ